VNVPEKKEIEVVDVPKRAILARWPVAEENNFPMTLDEAHHRLFVAVWKPSQLVVFDTEGGKQIASREIAGPSDDLSRSGESSLRQFNGKGTRMPKFVYIRRTDSTAVS